jgi:hypothetical protein
MSMMVYPDQTGQLSSDEDHRAGINTVNFILKKLC